MITDSAHPQSGGRRFNSAYILVALCLIPVLFLLFASFCRWNPDRAVLSDWPTLAAYRQALVPNRIWEVFDAFQRAALVATLECILAFPVAWILVRRFSPRARLIAVISITVPFFCSPFARAFAWRLILQQNGLISEILGFFQVGGKDGVSFAFNEYAVCLALFSGTFAFAVFPVLLVLLQVPEATWQASECCGAGRIPELLRIALPLSKTALGFAWSAVFLCALGSSEEVWLVGGQRQHSLGAAVRELFDANAVTGAFALGLTTFCAAVLTIIVVFAAIRRSAEHGLHYAPFFKRDGTSRYVRPFETGVVIFSVAVCVAPLLGVVLLSITTGSAQHPWRLSKISLDSYAGLLHYAEARDALIASVLMSAPVALLTAAGGFFCALALWLGRSRRLIAATLFLMACVPADVYALGLTAIQKLLGGTRGSASLLLIGLMTWCLPFATAVITSSLLLLAPNLLTASYDLGGRPFTTIRRVVLGLVYPAVLSSVLVSGLLALNEYGRTFYLSGGSEYLSEFVKGKFSGGLDPRAYSLGAVMVLSASLSWALLAWFWHSDFLRTRFQTQLLDT